MAVTRASASRSVLSTPQTIKNKEKERQRNGPTVEGKKKQKKSKTCSSSLIKRKKSPGVRLIGGRIYDSENGKTCHQCRQKTLSFSLSCENLMGEKKCTFHFCHICLLNRYGERAEKAVELGCQWKCPSCRGICNCSKCMKKRGFMSTGVLLYTAKANGFSSVSEVLHFKEIENHEQDEDSSPKKQKASSQEPAGKEGMDTNGSDEKINSTCFKALEKVCAKGNDKKKREQHDATITDDPMIIGKENEMPSESKMIKTNYDIQLIENISSELTNDQDNELEEPTNRNIERTLAENMIVDEAPKFSSKAAEEIHIKVSDVDIPLPQGTELNRVADLDLPAEDVGHALQFLEFCEAFGQILDLKKGQPELLLRELTGAKDSHRKHDFSVERLHIKLLSLIQNDREKGSSSLKARGRNSWLEALENYMAKCPYLPSEIISECSELGPDKYEKLNSSNKLRILTFLCDEALGTTDLRNWIDEKNSQFLEERKRAKEMFLIKEKNERKKLQDEVAKAILLNRRAPLSIEEHENIVSVIKVEVAQALAEKLETANTKMKREHSHSVRSYPILSDAVGRKFWRLRSYYGEMDVLLQEVAYEYPGTDEKWFAYDRSEKGNIERYIPSFKET